MPPFDLVLFDLDGTLLDPERRVRPANKRAFNKLRELGVRVGFATGRSPVSVGPFVQELDPTGPLILFNGCMVWCCERRAPVCTHHLHRDDALAALRVVTEARVHCNLYIGDRLFVAERSATSLDSERKDGVPHEAVGSLPEFLERCEEAPIKLLMIREGGDFTALLPALRAALRNPCTLVNSEPTYLELLPPGVCKGGGLDVIAREFGIPPARVLAFGDGRNDLELLQHAGMGVAMGNAHPDLQQAADRIIEGNDSDSIAALLTEVFFGAG